ncbi:MAG: hypothetical protein IKQ44_00215 [Lachnospiraceae bacterium]|nr:hypothetical protein [Lachnospiraceae bacterium]
MKRNEFDEIIRTLWFDRRVLLIVKRKSDMLKSLKREGGKHGLQHKDIRKNVEPAG